ncbi:MAG: hypothetical protein ABJA71_09010 [Ginsengibacter sp.]
MSEVTLKNKIHKSLEQMDVDQLKSAWLILQALSNQQKYAGRKVNKAAVDAQIANGIEQLDNGEGTGFRIFLNELQASYGKRK